MTEEILTKAIQSEVQARDYYNRVAEKVARPKVKKTISKMARDEEGHISTLSRRYRSQFNKDYSPVEVEPDPKLKIAEEDAYTVDTALQIISIAIGLEEEAIEFYSEQHDRSDDEEEKKMLKRLFKFEQGHKKKFQKQLDRLNKGFTWIAQQP